MPQSKNIARLSEDMKRELIAIIGQMKDPRLKTGLLTVMRIELAPDLSRRFLSACWAHSPMHRSRRWLR